MNFAVAVALAMAIFTFSPVASSQSVSSRDQYIRDLDELHALWSFYKRAYIHQGRVISPDEGGITTSEGQSYALLRAVWTNDRETFDRVWGWTQKNLQIRHDRLFSWKWKSKVLDANAATDADTDIALALIFASRRFNHEPYLHEARGIIKDIWEQEVLVVGDRYFLTGGNWATKDEWPTVHVGYLAPYAYEIFARVDPAHPWQKVVESSYEVLEWIFVQQKKRLPPIKVYIDKKDGSIHFNKPGDKPTIFTYDVFPIYWRVALDADWFGRDKKELRQKMLAFFTEEWGRRKKIFDQYDLEGTPLSSVEGQPLYATLHSLAHLENSTFASELQAKKLRPLWKKAIGSTSGPYYLQNWLWFDRAFQLDVTLHFEEFLGFLRPFHFDTLAEEFPLWLFLSMLILFVASFYSYYARIGFIGVAVYLCSRYLLWRVFNTLNFVETFGPIISVALLAAEVYCFSTVVLLIVQVGFRDPRKKGLTKPENTAGFLPSVDIFIPIYSEPLSILENTLVAAVSIDYPNKKVYVCDDSHQESVRELAERLGAYYIKGPKKHAKAGNMNNALGVTSGDLVVIFDTDHIPAKTFLRETVPFFLNPKVGFVQTPHHFYNEDIFQRAFQTQKHVPNEQDMFNHAIQSGRHTWGGSFFVGSGAVFRRQAMEEVGGFNTMSITEDIHTSQHLHAKGWQSAFVDKDIAVGLTAENLASYLTQRRRWMLGCMQIFFKDNPLLLKGLSLRHKIGYFASLYYFFFPVARVIFMMTPLLFLLFHWHPIFADVSVLLAYLVPFMVALPLLSSALLPGWPRMFWGTVYENIIAFPLFRSMFDLFLPKHLGFKVTPKGIVSDRRAFDFESTKITLVVVALTLFAIGKGLSEFFFFQIEKDAYLFNLAWAVFNLLSLLMALFVAWESPQRRAYDRMKFPLPFKLYHESGVFECEAGNFSLSGLGFGCDKGIQLPEHGVIEFQDESKLRISVKKAHVTKSFLGKQSAGYQFTEIEEANRHQILLHLFANPKHWENAHSSRARTSLGMGIEFFKASYKAVREVLVFALEQVWTKLKTTRTKVSDEKK